MNADPDPQHWTNNAHLYLYESNIQAGNVTIVAENAEVRVRRDEPCLEDLLTNDGGERVGSGGQVGRQQPGATRTALEQQLSSSLERNFFIISHVFADFSFFQLIFLFIPRFDIP